MCIGTRCWDRATQTDRTPILNDHQMKRRVGIIDLSKAVLGWQAKLGEAGTGTVPKFQHLSEFALLVSGQRSLVEHDPNRPSFAIATVASRRVAGVLYRFPC